VLNYADIANQRRLTIPSTNAEGVEEDSFGDMSMRSRSNISGLNHESDSPRNARDTSALGIDPKTPGAWPPSARRPGGVALFNEELEQDGSDMMVFEQRGLNQNGTPSNSQKHEDSRASPSNLPAKLEKKANLELVWQKANSINGIRKLYMSFKEERRLVSDAIDENDEISREYWQVCDQFLQMLELKQAENLSMLLKEADD